MAMLINLAFWLVTMSQWTFSMQMQDIRLSLIVDLNHVFILRRVLNDLFTVLDVAGRQCQCNKDGLAYRGDQSDLLYKLNHSWGVIIQWVMLLHIISCQTIASSTLYKVGYAAFFLTYQSKVGNSSLCLLHFSCMQCKNVKICLLLLPKRLF